MNSPGLIYPLGAPERGGWVKVAPGVLWIRLPLPYRLDHINVWALADGPGWTLVDTGVRTEETMLAWDRLSHEALLDRPLHRVLVTHMHPDHVGMAGWLTRKHQAKLWMSALEYLMCRALVSDSGREAPEDALRFYREAGWSAFAIDAYRARFGAFGKSIHALPDSYIRLKDGQSIRIGDHSWEVVVGTGHSPEHCSLYCADLKLLISGDQVLPKISSNVSVFPLEPEANPMADWLASLERIKFRLPDDVLVLPAHQECFRGLHARIDHMRRSQEESLDRLREVLSQPRRVIDVFGALFRNPVLETDSHQLGLATGEAMANLNFLVKRGEVRKELRKVSPGTAGARV